MSYTINSLVECENVQAALDENFFGAASGMFNQSNPFLDYVVGDENAKVGVQEPLTARGKLKGVTVKYFNRYLETDNDFVGSNSNDCTGGGELTENFYTYDLDETEGDSIKKSIPITDLVTGCQDDATYVGQQIQMMINVLERKINTDGITQAAALVGNFRSTGNSNAITVDAKNTDGAWVTNLIEDVQYEFTDMEYNDKIVAIGGSKLWSQYWSAIGAGCCIDKKGIDQGALAAGTRIMPIYDRKIDDIVGSERFFAFAPAAIQMLKYNRYGHGSPAREITQADTVVGTVTSPFSGLTFDYRAKLECETWNFFVGLTYKFVVAPDDLFDVNDDMSGVNLFNQFTAQIAS